MGSIDKNVGSNFTPSERAARIGSRRIQNLRLLAKMASGQKNTSMSQAGATNRTAMNNEAQLENTRIAGKNKLGAVKQRGANQRSLEALQNKNTIDRMGISNEQSKEKDYRNAGFGLMKSGVPGDKVNNLVNTPGWADADTSGIAVPHDAPDSSRYGFESTPTFGSDGKKTNPANYMVDKQTGRVVKIGDVSGLGLQQGFGANRQEGAGGNASGQDVTDQDINDIILNGYRDQLGGDKFDPRNITPEQRKVMIEMGTKFPDLYKQLKAQYEGGAQAQ